MYYVNNTNFNSFYLVLFKLFLSFYINY